MKLSNCSRRVRLVISALDHDLGDDQRGTGYDVILWIENAVATEGFLRHKSSFTLPIVPLD